MSAGFGSRVPRPVPASNPAKDAAKATPVQPAAAVPAALVPTNGAAKAPVISSRLRAMVDETMAASRREKLAALVLSRKFNENQLSLMGDLVLARRTAVAAAAADAGIHLENRLLDESTKTLNVLGGDTTDAEARFALLARAHPTVDPARRCTPAQNPIVTRFMSTRGDELFGLAHSHFERLARLRVARAERQLADVALDGRHAVSPDTVSSHVRYADATALGKALRPDE